MGERLELTLERDGTIAVKKVVRVMKANNNDGLLLGVAGGMEHKS